MQEEWKDISGFEGRYQVSSFGAVVAVPFRQRYLSRTGAEAFRLTKRRFLMQQVQNSGYRIVHLHLDNKRTAKTVHRLVAAAFVPGEGETVNHIDGVKTNNLATNLEWVSQTRNHVHAVELGLNTQAIRVKHPTTGTVFPSIASAARAAHVSHRNVSAKWMRA